MWRTREIVKWERDYRNAIIVANRIKFGVVSTSHLKSRNFGKDFYGNNDNQVTAVTILWPYCSTPNI